MDKPQMICKSTEYCYQRVMGRVGDKLCQTCSDYKPRRIKAKYVEPVSPKEKCLPVKVQRCPYDNTFCIEASMKVRDGNCSACCHYKPQVVKNTDEVAKFCKLPTLDALKAEIERQA